MHVTFFSTTFITQVFVCWFVFVHLDELVNHEGITQSVGTGVGEVSGRKGTGEQEAWYVSGRGQAGR